MVIAWISLSIVGLVFATFDAVGAYNRWRLATVAVPEDTRLIDMARSTMLNQTSNVLLFSIMLTIGILAGANSLHGVFPWLMFAINLILVVSTIQQYRFRKRMYQRSDKAEHNRAPRD